MRLIVSGAPQGRQVALPFPPPLRHNQGVGKGLSIWCRISPENHGAGESAVSCAGGSPDSAPAWPSVGRALGQVVTST